MAHRGRVLPGDRTIRFHYANCGSYNADFDGDEMNVQIPRDYLDRAKAEELMLSSKNYIVPENCKKGLERKFYFIKSIFCTLAGVRGVSKRQKCFYFRN